MRTHAPDTLERLVAGVLEAAGAPQDVAATVAQSLVLSSLKGIDSHGVVRLPQYVEEIEAGLIRPTARPRSEPRGAIAVVEGRKGFGQVAGRETTRLACELARGHGVGLGMLSGVRHVGRLGEYVERSVAGGCAALAWCNAGPPGGRVVPHGGARPLFGTNPVAYAFPTGGSPVVADFSTSATAEGRVRVARQEGGRLPEGWIVDSNGTPSTDPADLYAGGALLPAGGHKGTALALLAELLGGVLAGAGTSSTGGDPGNGVVLLAVDSSAVRPREEVAERVDRVLAALRTAPPAPGTDRVVAPGDPELETEARRRTEGIPVADGTWSALVAVAERYGVDAPTTRTA